MRSTLGAVKPLHVVSMFDVETLSAYEIGGGITASINLKEPYAFWKSEKDRIFWGHSLWNIIRAAFLEDY